jgi:ABC-type branched-subunit amino acid transport system ATPase component
MTNTNTVTLLQIDGLYGKRSISIPIEGNRIILVGANGLGKSTVISILYLLLSRQWKKLAEFHFDVIRAEVGGQLLEIPKKTLVAGVEGRRQAERWSMRLTGRHSPETRVEALQHLLLGEPPAHEGATPDIAPLSQVQRRELYEIRGMLKPFVDDAARLTRISECLKSAITAQVLYLPTYRRIEKELRTVFPEMDEELRRYRSQRALSARREQSSFLELVEFGMQDVEANLLRVLSQMKDTARAELNSLTGSYLRDVVRGQAQTYDPRMLRELDEAAIARILERIEENALDTNDKALLKQAVQRIRERTRSGDSTASAQPDERAKADNYIAHYFGKLVETHNALTKQEVAIQDFSSICSKYLQGKQMVYDERAYSVQVVLEDGTHLKLQDLSSGEKQIVSVFAHLLLDPGREFVVLIDEPELSLAVHWQKLLLPDLWASKRCVFLAAATHSPFIFDNELDHHAHDMARFMT